MKEKSKVKNQKSKPQFKTQNFKFLLLVFTFYFLLLSFVYAQTIPSTELISNAPEYDGKTVAFAGEVIGDVMKRGSFAWININDGKRAIGIWLDKNLAREISYTGSFRSLGDRVEVIGIFHRACLEHGGDLDIHALSLKKITTGKPVAEKLNEGKKSLVFILAGVLCLVLILRLLAPK